MNGCKSAQIRLYGCCPPATERIKYNTALNISGQKIPVNEEIGKFRLKAGPVAYAVMKRMHLPLFCCPQFRIVYGKGILFRF